jgi:5-methylcytosine-specific restriction protein A
MTTQRLRGRKGVEQRKRRLKRTNGLCERCIGAGRWTGKGTGRVSAATVVNHIVPLAFDGSDDDENTENLCGDCDRFVTAQQFSHKLKRPIGRDGWPLETRDTGGSAEVCAQGAGHRS